MKRIGVAPLCATGGNVVAALVSYFLIGRLSANTRDRPIEAAMTSAFVWESLGAVAAFVVGFVRAGDGSGSRD